MVAIQILSDLHLETPKAYDIFDIPVKAPYLALLGDIGYASKHHDDYCGFLERQLANFQAVFLVLGNHEPWDSDWEKTRKQMRDFEQTIKERRSVSSTDSMGEFVVLDRTRYDIPTLAKDGDPGLAILGSTLFSRVPSESRRVVSGGIQDFYMIGNWTVEEHSSRFEEELAWLNTQVEALSKEDRNIAIFTHYSPTTDDRAIDPKYYNSERQSGFATDLKEELCWKSQNVKLWAFGHTPFNCDFVDSYKRVLAHQRGYYFRQADAFDVEKVVKI
jgi:hypothetical protein